MNHSAETQILLERERGKMSDQFYAMNGGDGSQSYTKNSSLQRGAMEAAEEIIKEEIGKKFDIEKLFSSTSTRTISIGDFGCSTGPNTFLAMQIIVEAISKKFETNLSNFHIPEFQVYFNDRTSNDFNTLFALLPFERQYHAAGVPGSFHYRQLPMATLHFAYSSCTLHWLSEVPKEVMDHLSPAWNKGRILYYGDKKEVFNAYAHQFAKDLNSFLKARAQELVFGGLMALLFPCEPNPIKDLSNITLPSQELLGSCLIDLAKKGLFDTAKVDSFNLPVYFTHPNELKALIERNEDFNIERMEILNNSTKHLTTNSKSFTRFIRALYEGLLKVHFGSEIMDELFKTYEEKVEESALLLNPNENSMITFVLLKCKRIS